MSVIYVQALRVPFCGLEKNCKSETPTDQDRDLSIDLAVLREWWAEEEERTKQEDVSESLLPGPVLARGPRYRVLHAVFKSPYCCCSTLSQKIVV